MLHFFPILFYIEFKIIQNLRIHSFENLFVYKESIQISFLRFEEHKIRFCISLMRFCCVNFEHGFSSNIFRLPNVSLGMAPSTSCLSRRPLPSWPSPTTERKFLNRFIVCVSSYDFVSSLI